MNLNEQKKIIQDTYDKGEFCGLSYNEVENKIGMAVKNKKHWITVFLKSDFPKKDFSELQKFIAELGKPKKAEKIIETT